MNKTTFLALLSIFVVALFVVGLVYNNGAKDVIEDSSSAKIEDNGSISPASGGAEEDTDVPEQGDVQEYTFTNEYGDGEKSIKTSYSYVYNNPVEKKLAAVSQNYRWTFLAYAASDHPFSEKIVLRKASMGLRRALKEVQAFRKKDAPLSEPCLRIEDRKSVV